MNEKDSKPVDFDQEDNKLDALSEDELSKVAGGISDTLPPVCAVCGGPVPCPQHSSK